MRWRWWSCCWVVELLLCNDGDIGTVLAFAMEVMELLLDSRTVIVQ